MQSSTQADHKEIKRQLMELAYIDVINKLNDEFPVIIFTYLTIFQSLPSMFYDNKMRWCHLLIKTKSVQDIFNDFTYRIA